MVYLPYVNFWLHIQVLKHAGSKFSAHNSEIHFPPWVSEWDANLIKVLWVKFEICPIWCESSRIYRSNNKDSQIVSDFKFRACERHQPYVVLRIEVF